MISEELKSDFCEKYRPQLLNEIMLPKHTEESISKYISEGIIPNLFLCSRCGQGKTSLAKVLVNEFNVDYLYINSSLEGNIDTVRNKVLSFAKTMSIKGDFKIVIFDEADGFRSSDAQKSLHCLMEDVSDNTRFIIIANSKYKILEPIRSRCVTLDVTPTKEQCLKKVIEIIKKENIIFNPSLDKDNLLLLIKNFHPDLRSILKEFQNCIQIDKTLKFRNYEYKNLISETIYDYIEKSKIEDLRKFLIEHEGEFNNDYSSLLIEFYKFILNKEDIKDEVKASWTIILNDYLYKSAFVIDNELNSMACFYTLMKNIS